MGWSLKELGDDVIRITISPQHLRPNLLNLLWTWKQSKRHNSPARPLKDPGRDWKLIHAVCGVCFFGDCGFYRLFAFSPIPEAVCVKSSRTVTRRPQDRLTFPSAPPTFQTSIFQKLSCNRIGLYELSPDAIELFLYHCHLHKSNCLAFNRRHEAIVAYVPEDAWGVEKRCKWDNTILIYLHALPDYIMNISTFKIVSCRL